MGRLNVGVSHLSNCSLRGKNGFGEGAWQIGSDNPKETAQAKPKNIDVVAATTTASSGCKGSYSKSSRPSNPTDLFSFCGAANCRFLDCRSRFWREASLECLVFRESRLRGEQYFCSDSV